MLQFIDNEVVIAFGGQPARHPPGGGAIAGIPDHPAGGRAQRVGAGIFPQPGARAGGGRGVPPCCPLACQRRN